MIPNPAYAESRTAKEEVLALIQHGEFFEDYFPHRKVEEQGAWIMVQKPPCTEYTVPPLSIWYAMPWDMTAASKAGIALKRVKILTPSGELGLFPHEFSVVTDISFYVGKDHEGVFFRTMNDTPVVNYDALHYLMSRGISREEATLMIIEQMKDPTYGWFEIAPQYAAWAGKEWPTQAKCPFATPECNFVVIEKHSD